MHPIREVYLDTPSGQSIQYMYKIDLKIRSDFIIKDVFVLSSEIDKQNLDIIIGMDIINLGDFSVSNYNGKTSFSFRIPSLANANYLQNNSYYSPSLIDFDKINKNK